AIAAVLLLAAPWITFWTFDEGLVSIGVPLYAFGAVGTLATIGVLAGGAVAAIVAFHAITRRDARAVVRPIKIASPGALLATLGAGADAMLAWGGMPSWGAACGIAGAVLALVGEAEEVAADDFGAARSPVPVAIPSSERPAQRPAPIAELRFVCAIGSIE